MTRKLPACTARDVERALRQLGFLLDRQAGSHRVFIHPTSRARVVMPVHSGDLKPGMLSQLIKDMAVSRQKFHGLLRGRRAA